MTELVPSHPAEPAPANSNISKSSTIDLLHENSNGISQESINTAQDDLTIDCNTVVINSTVAPAVVPYKETEPTEEDVTEDTQLLPNKEKVCIEAVIVKEMTSHGADLGLKWFHLVCCMLVLAVVVPLMYVMFYLDKHDHILEHTTEHLPVHTVDDLPPLHAL